MYHNALKKNEKMISIAPMMDWTDRHCRYFHRGLTGKTLLYTEMVTSDAVLHGDRSRLLRYDDCEHPLALQLGGSDPVALAEAAQIGAASGFDEINLNVGCPSDRVQSGTFGACLMREPDLVGACVAAMKNAVDIPVTVKCRIGVDDQVPSEALAALAETVIDNNVDAIWVHARKAWLKGLSPKQNRDIPPLDYDEVYQLKQRQPETFIGINGGIEDLPSVQRHMAHVDGVMIGRAAYHTPSLLAGFDDWSASGSASHFDLQAAARRMIPYIDAHIADGGRAVQVTRHMLGLFPGVPGARRYRQILTVDARSATSGEIIEEALEALRPCEEVSSGSASGTKSALDQRAA